MSAIQPLPHKMSEEEYLAFERASEFKNEYADGQVIPMQVEKLSHNLICTNSSAILIRELSNKNCYVLALRMRVKTLATRRYSYPDIVLICGEPEFIGYERDTITNPTILIEILSPTTEKEDRGKKLREYRQIESLQEYLLISQETPQIERYLRQKEKDWLYSEVSGLESKIVLPSIGITLALSDVYKKVNFPEEKDS
jgi:Uma2 family endonuclease